MAALILAGCTEQIDTSSRYVFKEETITSYLSKQARYSEYMQLLDKTPVSGMTETTVRQLLTARGNYTVFAPTNEAIQAYLDTLAAQGIIDSPSWDGFPNQRTLDSICQVIVYNSVIDGGDVVYYETANFPTTNNAEIPLPNMYDRKLAVRYTDDPDSILINDSPIDVKNHDILAINGVIHDVRQVLAPSNNTMAHLLKDYLDSNSEGFHVNAMLVDAIGLMDRLDVFRDEKYEDLYQKKLIPEKSAKYGNTFYTPEHRYIGFTYFAETDSFWTEAIGKPALDITIQDVMDYLVANNVYPDAKVDNNYKDEKNLLYQFVTYHFLPERLSTDHLVYHYNEKGYNINIRKPNVAVMEYYYTLGKRRLLKLFESQESQGVYINRFPNLDNGRKGTYHELSCEERNEGIRIGAPNLEGKNNIRNGIIYPINQLLWYSDNTRNELQRSRIRWNVTAMWPEFMNNDIRASVIENDKHKNVYIPSDDEYKYLDDVFINEGTEFNYWTGRGNGWQNMQGDEMSIRGLFDCTMRLPPVPRRGTYELRFAIQCGGDKRGMTQFYWGSNIDALAAMGVPMDLRQGTKYLHTSQGNVPSDIGYEDDVDDDDYNAEVDKRMRNNGFMKGCEQYCAGGPGTGKMMRASDICVRRIIVRQTMDPDQVYYIRFKTVMDDPTRYFYMDYMEYCAKEVYDNPETPEDIW